MKKRIITIVVALLLVAVTAVTIYAANNETRVMFGMSPYYCNGIPEGHNVPGWAFVEENHSGYHMSHYQIYIGTAKCSICNRTITKTVHPGCTANMCVMVGK